MKLEFTTVDVFTDRPFGGNPLAVVTDAAGPVDRADAGDRRRVQPRRDDLRAAAPGPGAHRRGPHLHAQGRDAVRRPSQCRHGLRAGARRQSYGRRHGRPAGVRGEGRPGAAWSSRARTASSSPRVWPRRSRSALGEEIAPEIVAEACSLQPDDIEIARHRPASPRAARRFVFAEVTSRAALARGDRTDRHASRRHLPMERAVGIHLYVAAKEHGVEIQSRMFAPLFGVPEDPGDRRRQRRADRPAGASPARGGPRPVQDASARASTWDGRASSRPSAEKKAGKVDRDLYRRALRADDERHDRPRPKAPDEGRRRSGLLSIFEGQRQKTCLPRPSLLDRPWRHI